VQEGFDYVTDRWLEDEQKRLDDKQSEGNVTAYSARNGQLMALAREWDKSRQAGDDFVFDPQAEISRSAEDGIDHAVGVSGESPK
jgi:hypothetical protein